MSFIEFDNVCKYYTMGETRIAAADHISFFAERGEFCVIVGPSGAGKTTVLNMLGGMDTCDEGRMLAEMGDFSFQLGTVADSYETFITSPACKATCAASVLECIPECCDCTYQPYCGQCPVINLALDGDIFPTNSQNYRCQIYKGMLDILFGILQKNDQQELQILQNWAQGGMET